MLSITQKPFISERPICSLTKLELRSGIQRQLERYAFSRLFGSSFSIIVAQNCQYHVPQYSVPRLRVMMSMKEFISNMNQILGFLFASVLWDDLSISNPHIQYFTISLKIRNNKLLGDTQPSTQETLWQLRPK